VAGQAVLRYRPQGKVLAEYLASAGFVQVIRGPLGSGKTTCSAAKLFRLICEQRPNKETGVRKSRWAAIRNTYPDLKNTTIRDWKAIVPENCGRFTMGAPPEHKLDFDLPDGTRVVAEVLFLALDNPDDVKKLRGLQLTGAWMNEGKEMPKAILDMLTGRVDRYPYPGFSTWVGILMDTNAWDDDHWLEELDKLRLKGELPGYEFFVQPAAVHKVKGKWEVNPEAENLKVLKPDYYQRQIAGKKEDWIRVNLENRIGISYDGKAVHPDYQEAIHLATDVLRPRPGIVNVGLDFGLTPAATFWQKQPNGQWWGLEEIVEYSMGGVRFAEAIKARCSEMQARCGGGLTFVFKGDPSGDDRRDTDEGTYFQVLLRNKVPATPCSTNDPQIRRDALDRPLQRMVGGLPGMLVSPSMKTFRRGMAGAWCYKRIEVPGEERFKDVPDKGPYSHVCESAEYALMDAGEHGIVNAPGARNGTSGSIVVRRDWDPRD
jgi:hypothetical protein